MRRFLSPTLGLVLALSAGAVACAAPSEEEVGSAEGAAAVADGRLDEGEISALRAGAGLTCRQDGEDSATICAHERGVVVLTDNGVALLEAKGDLVTGKALAVDARETDDVGAVLEPVSGGDESATQSLRPQGVTTKLFLEAITSLFERATAKTAAKAAEREAQVVAARSAEKAGDLTALAKQLRSGEGIARAGTQTILAGSTEKSIAANTKRWAKATGRTLIGVPIEWSSNGSGPEEVVKFMAFMATQKARLAPGHRLAILMEPGHGSRYEFAEAAREAGIDFVWVGRAGNDALGDAVIEVSGNVRPADVLRDVADQLWRANSNGVGPL